MNFLENCVFDIKNCLDFFFFFVIQNLMIGFFHYSKQSSYVTLLFDKGVSGYKPRVVFVDKIEIIIMYWDFQTNIGFGL